MGTFWGGDGQDMVILSSKRAAFQPCSVEDGFDEHDMVVSEALADWSARPSARNGHGSGGLDCCSTSDG
jgi:hypothetical protein